MSVEKKTILITSNEPWGDIWFSKQHYANELSLLGHKVYFINAPTQWSIGNFLDNTIKIRPISPSLFVVEYKNPFPLRFFKKLFFKLNDWIVGRRIIKKINPHNHSVIWWQFDPFRFVNIPFPATSKRIYHIVDPYQHIWTDQAIASKADLLVFVSKIYEKSYQNIQKKNIYIPHGISKKELTLDANLLEQHKREIGRDFILFVGTINPDVDLYLLERIAIHFPKKKLVLIGPIKIKKEAFSPLLSQKNIIYLGPKNATHLKEYVALAKVGIVPYKKKKTENIHRTPLKIMNYIAQYCPIVTTLNYELTALNHHSIFEADNLNSFIQLLEQIINEEKNINKDIVRQYQQEVLYPKLIEKILKHV